MTTIDGYFSQRPMPEAIIALEEHEPAKINPELDPEEQERQQRQQQYAFSEGERSSPPSYRSRRPSSSFSGDFDVVEHNHNVELQAQFVRSESCICGHPQCITCVVNGNAFVEQRRDRRLCRMGVAKKPKRIWKFGLVGILMFSLFYILIKLSGCKFDLQAEQALVPNALSCSTLPENAIHTTFRLSINDSIPSFTLKQSVHDTSHLMPELRIVGNIEVRNAIDEEIDEGQIMVTILALFSDSNLKDDIRISALDDGVFIESNRTRSLLTHDPYLRDLNCASIRATIIVPQGSHVTNLQYLTIHSETLDIEVNRNLHLTIDESIISSVTGNIISKGDQIGDESTNVGFQPKSMTSTTISGSIKGEWGLGEMLTCRSESGHIDIALEPLLASRTSANETTLDLRTVSGDIQIRPQSSKALESYFSLKTEKFFTSISSISGNIRGQQILGSKLSLSTISGSIFADIIPAVPDKCEGVTELITDVKSGSTSIKFSLAKELDDVNMLKVGFHGIKQSALAWIGHKKRRVTEFLSDGDHSISNPYAYELDLPRELTLFQNQKVPIIHGHHQSVNGRLSIHYPQFFEGSILAKSLTGSVRVDGQGVDIVRKTIPPFGKTIEAIKGDKTRGSLKIECITGDVNVDIGNL